MTTVSPSLDTDQVLEHLRPHGLVDSDFFDTQGQLVIPLPGTGDDIVIQVGDRFVVGSFVGRGFSAPDGEDDPEFVQVEQLPGSPWQDLALAAREVARAGHAAMTGPRVSADGFYHFPTEEVLFEAVPR